MIILSIVWLLAGILITVCAMPLVYNRIPMNSIYGFRLPQTFISDKAWYHLNEVGGMLFSLLGFPLFLSGILGFFLPENLLVIHSMVTGIVILMAIGFSICLFMRYVMRYQSRT